MIIPRTLHISTLSTAQPSVAVVDLQLAVLSCHILVCRQSAHYCCTLPARVVHRSSPAVLALSASSRCTRCRSCDALVLSTTSLCLGMHLRMDVAWEVAKDC